MNNIPNVPNIPMKPSTDGGKTKSIISLVCGIASIVFGLLSTVIPFGFIIILATAIVGLVMGISGRGDSIKATGKASGLATAGFVVASSAFAFLPSSLSAASAAPAPSVQLSLQQMSLTTFLVSSATSINLFESVKRHSTVALFSYSNES